MALLKVTFSTHCGARQGFQTALSTEEVAVFNASTVSWPEGIQCLVHAQIFEDPSQVAVFEVIHRYEAVLLVDGLAHPKPFEMPAPDALLDSVFVSLMGKGGLPDCDLEDGGYEVTEYEPA